MVQEIITYLLVAAAFIFAGWKMANKFRKKKSKKKTDYKSGKISMEHNCSDCAAECILRDASTSYIKSDAKTCNKNYTKKD